MASGKNSWAICDICGWRYKHSVMQMNSYGLLVCPQDFEGAFDLKNNPQNKVPDVRDNPNIPNPRPEPFPGGQNLLWEQVTSNWENETNYWNLI